MITAPKVKIDIQGLQVTSCQCLPQLIVLVK